MSRSWLVESPIGPAAEREKLNKRKKQEKAKQQGNAPQTGPVGVGTFPGNGAVQRWDSETVSSISPI